MMEYKEYRYMGYTFKKTGDVLANSYRELYEIEGLKPAGQRPFLTSINDCRYFIADAVKMGYWIDGSGNTHDVK